MYRFFKATKDTYITNRAIHSRECTGSNTGQAGTLDLFKLYGMTMSGSTALTELSRILVSFDLTQLSQSVSANRINPSSPSFSCRLLMYDVYGGQTTPHNFTVAVAPLSMSWDEGRGRDVVYYQDQDAANFVTSSWSSGAPALWNLPGADAAGSLGDPSIDVITSADLGSGVENIVVSQSFLDGSEDLNVDVTKVIRAMLSGTITNNGFRISYSAIEEQDQKTRFVKRFASTQTTDPRKIPKLLIKFDDSSQGSTPFDPLVGVTSSVRLTNFGQSGMPTNLLLPASVQVVGHNCLLTTTTISTPDPASTGTLTYTWTSTGSQETNETGWLVGNYTSSLYVDPFDPAVIAASSVAKKQGYNFLRFNQLWTSLDGMHVFSNDSYDVKFSDIHTSSPGHPRNYRVTVSNVSTDYDVTDVASLRCFVFDAEQPFHRYMRVPQNESSVAVDAHYSVRDVTTDERVIPFDFETNSTRMKLDGEFHRFNLWMDSFVQGRTYVIDVAVVDGIDTQTYYDISPTFRIMSK